MASITPRQGGDDVLMRKLTTRVWRNWTLAANSTLHEIAEEVEGI
jgi:hypothetical protein